jgi:uridine kinase
MSYDSDFEMTIIKLDSFYKGLDKNDNPADYNFDHPDALDFDQIYIVIY